MHEPQDLIARLRARGVPVERRRIQPADFVAGRIAVERKTVRDFFGSVLRRRLFDQLIRLKEAYPHPILLLEGDLLRADGPASDAFWGALATVAVDLGVPILPAPDREASAALLARLWARATREPGATQVRFKPPHLEPAALQRFAVQGLPAVGDVLSDRLLRHFGTVRAVFQAEEGELTRVQGLGRKKAAAIARLLDRPYGEEAGS